MANIPDLPQNLTKGNIRKLIEACEGFYPIELMGEGYRGSSINKAEIPELGYKWSNSREFFKDVSELTGQANIKEVYKVLSLWQVTAPETLAPSEQPAATTPEKGTLEQLQKEAEEREGLKKEADTRAKEQTKQQIETLEEKAKLKEKVVYLEPEKKQEQGLSMAEETAKTELLRAAKLNPRTFVEEFSKTVIAKLPEDVKASVPPEQIEVVAKQVAADFLTRLVSENEFTSLPPQAFASLLKSDLVSQTLKKAALPTFSALTSITDGVTRSFLQPVVGEGLVNYYYENPKTEYKVTSEPTPNTTLKVDLGGLQNNFEGLSQNSIVQALRDKAQDKLIDFGKKHLTAYIAKLPADGFWGFATKTLSSSSLNRAFSLLSSMGSTYKATSTVGWVVQTALPQWAPLIATAAQKFGVDVGLAAVNTMAPVAAVAVETTAATGIKVVASQAGAKILTVNTAISGAASKIVVAAGVKIATKLGLTAIAQAIGSSVPIVGNIIAFIAVEVAGRVLKKIKEALPKIINFIKRNAAVIGIIPLGVLLLLPATIFTPILLAGASLFFVGTVLVGAGGATSLAAGGTVFVSVVFHTLLNATLGKWAKYIVISLLGITIYIALALFIINSGAYIVPPSGNVTQNLGQSEFITVTKEADVSSLTNAQLPKTVNYKITVSAPKGTLSNITFKNDCSVIKKDGSPTCVHPIPPTISTCPNPGQPDVPTIIDAGSPYVYCYSQTYDSAFADSLITDSFSVTADSPDEKGSRSIASASVIIGSPPTGCFDVTGNWPANYKASVLTSIATLTSSYPKYAAKVCSAGTLRIVYDPTKNPGGWGYYAGRTVYLNGGGLSSQIDTLYILAHEAGHHLGWVSGPRFYKQYLDTPGVTRELPLCSYENTTKPTEGFAESIALYVTKDESSAWKRYCSGTYQSKYPKHWNFDNDVLF